MSNLQASSNYRSSWLRDFMTSYVMSRNCDKTDYENEHLNIGLTLKKKQKTFDRCQNHRRHWLKLIKWNLMTCASPNILLEICMQYNQWFPQSRVCKAHTVILNTECEHYSKCMSHNSCKFILLETQRSGAVAFVLYCKCYWYFLFLLLKNVYNNWLYPCRELGAIQIALDNMRPEVHLYEEEPNFVFGKFCHLAPPSCATSPVVWRAVGPHTHSNTLVVYCPFII